MPLLGACERRAATASSATAMDAGENGGQGWN